MAGQIVLMRELLVIFYGNELSFGITLAGWLFWVGFGSLGIARWLVGRIREKLTVFALSEAGLIFILPLTLTASRYIGTALGFPAGEIIGVLPMSVSVFVLLAPVCVLSGFLFTLGCEIYEGGREKAARIGYVYIFEAIGASVGGLLVSLVLIRHLSSLYIMLLIGLLNLAAAFLLLRGKRMALIPAVLFLAASVLFAIPGGIDHLDSSSLKEQWRTYRLLASKNSVYGNIAVTRKDDLYSMFTNGLYAFSVPDKETSEMAAHFPLLEHPAPRDILLIGGGSSGLMREVLKHPVARVDYVELDPLVIKMAVDYLPVNKALSDPRVRIISDVDGRLFVKKTGQKYDVIIVSLPEPHTAQLNRFYTKEFYSEAYDILKEDGIISFSSYSNPNYLSEEQVKLYLTLRNTLKEVFGDVKITPGDTNYFLASKKEGLLTLDWRKLIEVLRQRNIEAQYMREYYLFSELSGERIDIFQSRLAQEEAEALFKQRELNTDFRPIAYYYDMVLWSTYFKYSLKRFFEAIDEKTVYIGAAILYMMLLVPVLFKGVLRKMPGWGVLTCVGTTGFAEMAFQVITLLSFQIMYGYVYYKLGIILTSYMVGLIFGGWLVTTSFEKIKEDHGLFVKTQAMISIYPLVLSASFWIFSRLKGDASFWLGSNAVFPYLPVIPGLIGGFQFPLANRLYLKNSGSGAGSSAGVTYGIDLFGACLGAVFVTIFLVPLAGIYMSCFLVAGLNLAGLALLLGTKKER